MQGGGTATCLSNKVVTMSCPAKGMTAGARKKCCPKPRLLRADVKKVSYISSLLLLLISSLVIYIEIPLLLFHSPSIYLAMCSSYSNHTIHIHIKGKLWSSDPKRGRCCQPDLPIYLSHPTVGVALFGPKGFWPYWVPYVRNQQLGWKFYSSNTRFRTSA